MTGTLGITAIMLVGFLVMFRVIPLNKIPGWVTGIILFILFAPVAWSYLQMKAAELAAGQYPFWVYVVVFLFSLLLFRVVLDFLVPGRRR